MARRTAINTSSPLSLYLTIYSKATHECYINHMEGAKILKDWLGKIDLPTERYPKILNPGFKVPRLLEGHESYELAKILVTQPDTSIVHKVTSTAKQLKEFKIASNAIYFVMSKEVIHNVY